MTTVINVLGIVLLVAAVVLSRRNKHRAALVTYAVGATLVVGSVLFTWFGAP